MYGYGIVAYFRVMNTLMRIFLLSLIFAVPLIIHNTNSELTTINDAFALFQTTIANMGASSV